MPQRRKASFASPRSEEVTHALLADLCIAVLARPGLGLSLHLQHVQGMREATAQTASSAPRCNIVSHRFPAGCGTPYRLATAAEDRFHWTLRAEADSTRYKRSHQSWRGTFPQRQRTLGAKQPILFGVHVSCKHP